MTVIKSFTSKSKGSLLIYILVLTCYYVAGLAMLSKRSVKFVFIASHNEYTTTEGL